MIANANLIVQFVNQIKSGIMIYINASVKSNMHAKNILVGILAHVFVRIGSI